MDVNSNQILLAGTISIIFTGFLFLNTAPTHEKDLLNILNNNSEKINNPDKLDNFFKGSINYEGAEIIKKSDYPFLEDDVLLLKPGKNLQPYLEIELPVQDYTISDIKVSMRNGAVLTNQPVKLGASDCGKSRVRLETSSNLSEEITVTNKLKSLKLEVGNVPEDRLSLKISLMDLDTCGLKSNEAVSIEEIRWEKY